MSDKLIDLLQFENTKKFWVSVIFTTLSCVICNLGIGCFYTAYVGTDPISVFVEGISFHCDLTVGQISTICNVILSIMMILLLRKSFGTGTFIQVLIAGPLIDFFCALVGSVFDSNTASSLARWILLAIGLIIYAFGLALSIDCNIGVSPFSFPPLYLEKITPLSIKYTQMISDAFFFIIGVVLGGTVGVGTLVAVGLTGPFMEFFIHLIKPLLDKLSA